MMLTLVEDRREASVNDAILKTISTRVAGGRRELNREPSRVSPMFNILVPTT
jgi:DNA excision repair protein ERCC-4